MRRHLFILFLVATFLAAGDWQSSLLAKPAKGRRVVPKKVKSSPKNRASSRLPGSAIKPKTSSRLPKLGGTPKVRPARLPGPPAPPVPTFIPAPLPSTPPIVIPTPVPPVIVAPPVVIRPRIPSVSISIGRLRPVRRTYIGSRVVMVRAAQAAPVRIVKIIDTTHVLVSQAGKTRKVRLLGLDAVTSAEVYPEVYSAAVAYMKKEFKGEIVHLDFDSSVGSEDQSGTQIAYVYRSGDKQLLNEAVIEHGFALAALAYEYQQKAGFKLDQTKAEKLNSGIWSQGLAEGS
ncbi:MAG: thermonuclease family protein [Pirellulaceae bacterium]